MPRTKKAVTVIIPEDQVAEVMRQFAKANSQLKVLEGEIEQQIQKVRDRFAKQIAVLDLEKSHAFDKLKAFAEHHREDLFSKKKSADYTHGIMGFRISTPKVMGAGKKAFDLIKELKLPFLRKKEEIDKDKILGVRKDDKMLSKLEKVGIKVVQIETFYIEPKEEELVQA